MIDKTCWTCFNETKNPEDEPCNSCRNYSNWVTVDVFKNIDNHGEAMVQRTIPPPQYDPKDVALNALDVQVAGSHYKKHGIQPVEYIHTNKIGYFEGNVIKYVTRWRDKGGIADLEKAKHYIDLLIELEGKNNG
jgi:uncharacterized protein (UPF0264 family)